MIPFICYMQSKQIHRQKADSWTPGVGVRSNGYKIILRVIKF